MNTNFFEKLWPQTPDGYISTWVKTGNRTRFFHTSQFSEAHAYLTDMADHDDAYFTVGLLGHCPSRGRGRAEDVTALPCMFMDFDLLGETNVHAKKALPKEIEDLYDFLNEASIPAPSTMVNSGNGIHAYWLFDRPWVFDDENDRLRAKKALQGFQRSIIKLAHQRRGWDFDNTGDLARVLRYPGTKNHKTNPPKIVELI